MSTVESLRARFAKEEHDRQIANRAALTGAVHAFPKQNGARVAATSVGARQPVSGASAAATKIWQTNAAANPPRPPVKPSSLSTASTGAVRAHQRSQENLLAHHERDSFSRTSSPSHTAANLAAANRKSQQAKSPASRAGRPVTQLTSYTTAGNEEDQHIDRLPEPGTVKDVKKWLQALQHSDVDGHPSSDTTDSRRPSDSLSAAQNIYHPQRTPAKAKTEDGPDTPQKQQVSPPPVILSPRPVRAVSAASSIDAIAQRDAAQEAASRRPAVPKKLERLRSTRSTDQKPKEQRAGQPAVPDQSLLVSGKGAGLNILDVDLSTPQEKPAAPPPRRSKPLAATQPDTTPNLPPLKPPRPAPVDPEPRPRLPSRTLTDQTTIRRTTPTPSLPPRPSIDTNSSQSRSPAPSTTLTNSKPRSSLDIPRHPFDPPMRRVSPSLSSNNLADAIVASSLASSRAPSPTKTTSPVPSLPPRPGHHRLHVPFQKDGRTPSPAKSAMRKTMREESSESDDEMKIRKGHKKFLRKHPNKHHEGTRKRWRDVITEEERKRYEGVWAGNRSLLLPAEPEMKDCVHGYVVRDIWRRSRLPDSTLEEVWELVDTADSEGNGGKGHLRRVEFVVGMWLIDQRLKGRKLPVKVSSSVWDSVRWTGGVKIRR